MKAIVIHDRDDVAQKITELLKSLGIPEEDLAIADDVTSARKALQSDLFDIAIVDLTIPVIRGRQPTYAAAEEFLSELFGEDTMHIPGDIIGITREAGALDSIDSDIGPHLMAVVEEDSGGIWKHRLTDRIKYIQKAARSRQRSANRHFDTDVAIITALDKELSPYKELFPTLIDSPHQAGVKHFAFTDHTGKARSGVAIAVGRAGQAPAASTIQSLVTLYRPSLCLMSGFCGGFKDEVDIGEIIIAETVFDWDYGKWKGRDDTEAIFYPRPEPISIRDRQIHSVARAIVETGLANKDAVLGRVVTAGDGDIKAVKIALGAMASGTAVVGNTTIISRIQKLSDKLLGVDMEVYAHYFASLHTRVVKPEFLAVKAVADFCDGAKSDVYHEACSFLSASVIKEILCERWKFDRPTEY